MTKVFELRKLDLGFHLISDPRVGQLITPEYAFNTIEEVAEWLIKHYKEPQA